MLNRLSSSLLFFILAFAGSLACAQQGFVSNANASAAGLNVAWSTQLRISAKGQLVDWQLIVDEDDAMVYYVVKSGKRSEVYSQADLDAFGNKRGVDGAKLIAEERKERLEIENKYYERDIEVSIGELVVPKTTILALGGDGQVISLDGNTGSVNWTQPVGDSLLPSTGLGASKKHVAVTNGSRVYCLDFDTGRVLWDRPCKHAVASSPICSDEHVYVPLINGRLQALRLEKFGVETFTLVGRGESRARPVVTEKNVVWTNEGGAVNVAPKGLRRTVSYRLNTSGPIVAQAAAGLGQIYSGSLDGFVYGINEQLGKLDWDVSTGAGITEAPVLNAGHLYVISVANKLFRLDAQEGLFSDGWQEPLNGISKLVGFGKQTIYCLDSNRGLVGVDRDTKAVTKRVSSSNIEMVLTNDVTDRLFLASRTGFIQCLHESASTHPQLLDAETPANAKMGDKMSGPKSDEDNPFGSDAEVDPSDDDNPFGDDASDDSGSDEDNPFGDG